MLGVRGTVPDGHPVLFAPAGGDRWPTRDGTRSRIAAGRGLTEREWGRSWEPPGEAEAADARRRAGSRPRDRGLEVDLPSRFDLPEGLQGHVARPRARDDEQRPVPPAPGQDEAPRLEADLHVLPGRAVVLPLHPADDHRHLPDVLLPP